MPDRRRCAALTGDVTVDLADVTFDRLCVLLRARTALDAVGRHLLLGGPARAATRIFELAGLQDTFRLATESG